MINRLIFFTRFWRWHPQVALRYLPIVEAIKKRCPPLSSILEVGSGVLGIAPYLGREIIGVDVKFAGWEFPLLRQIEADAASLPFKEKAFTVIISVDMLEHLPREKRKTAIAEMIRVAQKAIFIAVPCGKEAEEEDLRLHQIYRQKFGKSFSFLAEQVAYGLPRKQEMIEDIKAGAEKYQRTINIEVKDNLNITVRRFLMWGWMTNNLLINILFRKVFLVLIPILLYCNWQPTYRKIFFIELKN